MALQLAMPVRLVQCNKDRDAYSEAVPEGTPRCSQATNGTHQGSVNGGEIPRRPVLCQGFWAAVGRSVRFFFCSDFIGGQLRTAIHPGDALPADENALVIVNHQTVTDVQVLFLLARKAGRDCR